ncbi:hypothetical protein E2C01_000520 [Portunus trituberculatus]|uniref:Uncharacterized protein n=1 Tax=Portunus trituberculatus TaxID=210409 RepID=A0A5B7CFC6_PORTR|nr:hypothetical protein [Portunus trituberculatus]
MVLKGLRTHPQLLSIPHSSSHIAHSTQHLRMSANKCLENLALSGINNKNTRRKNTHNTHTHTQHSLLTQVLHYRFINEGEEN